MIRSPSGEYPDVHANGVQQLLPRGRVLVFQRVHW